MVGRETEICGTLTILTCTMACYRRGMFKLNDVSGEVALGDLAESLPVATGQIFANPLAPAHSKHTLYMHIHMYTYVHGTHTYMHTQYVHAHAHTYSCTHAHAVAHTATNA